ncbi:hypothetical protein BH09ACT8_BH09ACT8_52150 [soil metagenome]
MADRRKRSVAKQARRNARRKKAHQRGFAETQGAEEDAPLIDEVRAALDSGKPIDLLGLVSTVIVATAPPQSPILLRQPEEEAPTSLDELVAAFINVRSPETTALLAALGELVVDDLLRDRCHREADKRHDDLPGWLAKLAETTVVKAVRMTHVLGDGDELLLGVRLADGQDITSCVFIDHLSDSEVKDAFFVPGAIDSVLAVARASNTDPDTSFVDMDLAEARVRLDGALGRHLAMFMPEESDTWPATRALVQWLTRLLPVAASTLSVGQRDSASEFDVLDWFFESLVGAPFNRRDYRQLLLEYSLEGTGDPLRWSAARLTQQLGDDPLYDETMPLETQLDMPELLRAFVPFAHAECGIRQELTVEALAAIDDVAQDYRTAVIDDAEMHCHVDDEDGDEFSS